MLRCVSAAVLMFLVAASASGQNYEVAQMEVRSNWSEALVFADSVLLGRVADQYFSLEPSRRQRIRVSAPVPGTWSILPRDTLVTVGSGDSVQVNLPFPYYYKIDSEPFGAAVLALSGAGESSEVLGRTPLTYTSVHALASPLRVELEGFEDQSVSVGDDVWNYRYVRLSPLEEHAKTPVVQIRKKRRRWINVTALSVAALAGVAAVRYKFIADDRYDDYRKTGDPSLRPGVKRMDVYSGVALGVMQAGIGVVAVRFILR